MRQTRNTIMSATLLLALSMGAASLGVAAAQGDEPAAEETEVFEDEAGLVPPTETADGDGAAVACETEEDCADAEAPADPEETVAMTDAETAPEVAPAGSDEAGLAAPQDAVASDGAVLAAPGSTEENSGGGSSRPGTTPDT
jgi:hypothetical protein